MASSLPSNNKYYPNDPFILPQQVNESNDVHNLAMWLGQEDYFLPFTNNFGCLDNLFPLETTNTIDCSSNSNSTVDFGISALDYNHHKFYDDFQGNVCRTLQNYVSCTNNFAATPQCWGFEGHTPQVSGLDNSCSSTKIGRYSVEERKDRILRYLRKRNQRNFRKTIKYACRKTLADRRVRIRGRFAKNQEEDQSPITSYNRPYTHQDSQPLPFQNVDTQPLPFHNLDNKNEECGDGNEEWLQEAMSSLLYMPYISSWHPEIRRF